MFFYRVLQARLLSEGEQGIPMACPAFAQQPAGRYVAAWPREESAVPSRGELPLHTVEFLVPLLGTRLAAPQPLLTNRDITTEL